MDNQFKEFLEKCEHVQDIPSCDESEYADLFFKYACDSCFDLARKYEPAIIVKDDFEELLIKVINIFIDYFLFTLIDYPDFALLFFKFYDYDIDTLKNTFALHEALRYIEESMLEK